MSSLARCCSVAFLFASFSAFAEAAPGSSEKPNVLLVMVDDLGFADLGCYGSEIETPNLDRLAAEGLRFSQFYNTAKCHSSRVCLMSGLYCGQAGDASLSRAVTIAEALRPAGYHTAMSGKWHLKGQPTDRGFDRYFGHLSGATNFFTGDKTFRLDGEPWDDFDEDFYTTDADVDYAIRFLDDALAGDVEQGRGRRPFFLYVAFNAPHYPLQAPKEDVMKYRSRYRIGWDELRRRRYAKQLKLGVVRPEWKLSPRPDHVRPWDSLSEDDQDWEDFRMATFAAMIDCVDRNMGRLLKHIERRGDLDDTLVLFCSDNGACPFERTRGRELMPWDPRSHWTYDVGWAHADNTPFRLYKQNQHEGGISSPLIVRWPAGVKTKPGAVTFQPGHLIDVMATCLDVGGAKYPKVYEGRTIDSLAGRSLLPIFQGETRKPHENLFFQFSSNRAVRQGDLKAVSFRGGPWELYDLEADRSELNNLAKQRPEKVAELERLWHAWSETIERRKAKPVGEKPGVPNF